MMQEAELAERLDRLEAQIVPLTQSAKAIAELREELAPRVNEAVQALIVALADVEPDFQLEDFVYLLKNVMRNVKNLNFTLDQLKNLIDFVVIAEPVLKTTVPQIIFSFDELEQQGVFRLLATGLDILKKIGSTYSAEELRQIGDGIVQLVGCLQKLTSPEAMSMLDKAAGLPGQVNVKDADSIGIWGMLKALSRPEVKEGMGVAMEFTAGLARLKA